MAEQGGLGELCKLLLEKNRGQPKSDPCFKTKKSSIMEN